MTPEESVLLIRYVRALCPQQKFDEFTPDAWHDILAPYDLNEIRAAAARHIRAGNAFIAVGEIAAEISKARNDRLDRHTEAEPPTGDTGDATYKAALLAERKAIADGRTEPLTIPALPPGDTGAYEGRGQALLKLVGRNAPSRRPELAAPCPHCDAPTGASCQTNSGERRRDAHPTRIDASRQLRAGQDPTSREDVERELERRRAAAQVAVANLGETPEPADGFDPLHRTKPAAQNKADAS